jgi:hypothetical protein
VKITAMSAKASWVNLTTEQQEELDRVVPSPGWRVVPQYELPSVFPENFRRKIDSALMISTPTSTGGTYLAYSANRVDCRARAIDIEPFGLIVHSTGVGSIGVFLHHGQWVERSAPLPPGFWDEVARSGVGEYFQTRPPEGRSQGTLEELPRGHSGAFAAVVRELRRRIDTENT